MPLVMGKWAAGGPSRLPETGNVGSLYAYDRMPFLFCDDLTAWMYEYRCFVVCTGPTYLILLYHRTQ